MLLNGQRDGHRPPGLSGLVMVVVVIVMMKMVTTTAADRSRGDVLGVEGGQRVSVEVLAVGGHCRTLTKRGRPVTGDNVRQLRGGG